MADKLNQEVSEADSASTSTTIPNPGLVEGIALCGGNMARLGRRLGTSSENIRTARDRGTVSAGMALSLFEKLGVLLSKSLRRRLRCPHCRGDI